MNEFALKTQDGETITKVIASCEDEAVKLIAQLKRLAIEDVLLIFRVEKILK